MKRIAPLNQPLLFSALLLALGLLCPSLRAGDNPLKVYILAGQSNMQGHAHVRTFDHIGMDPKTAPMLKEMRDENGSAVVCEDVWISSIGSSDEERHGKLTAGYGASARGPKIGPEFTFGIYMRKLVDEPILIIKTAWGGKSLNTDFRPPSGGPYEFNQKQIDNLTNQGKDVEKTQAERAKASGHYYRLMMEHVKKVLGDIERVYPDYDADRGYEVAGFVWFQGWNDMVDGSTYPDRGKTGSYDQYSRLMAQFIRDVRKDLAAPKMPFVIGVMGVNGPLDTYSDSQKRYKGIHGEFRKAMAAPASLPEFKDNVAAVLTEEYWDTQLTELAERWGQVNRKRRELSQKKALNADQRKKQLDEFTSELFTPEELKIYEMGTSNAAYHYMGSAKIMAGIGKAFAEAIGDLSK